MEPGIACITASVTELWDDTHHRAPESELRGILRCALWPVRAEGEQDRGQTAGERSHEAAGAAVRDDQIALGQKQLLRNELFNPDVVRQRPDLGGGDARTDGHHHVRGKLLESSQHPANRCRAPA